MILTGFKTHPIYTMYMFNELGECFSIKSNKIIKTSRNKQGYLRYSLSKDGKARTIAAHRLVAQTFLPNPNNYRDVNHKNGIKSDNNASNLEWCTHSVNVQHAFDNGFNKVSNYARKLSSERNRKNMLENHPNKKAVMCFDRDGNFVKSFESIREASLHFGISEHAIGNNLIGRSKSCNNLIWKRCIHH